MTTEDEAPDAPRSGTTRPLGAAQQLTEDTARRLISAIEGSAPVKNIRANQIFSALLATLGAALVFSGIEIMVQNTSYLDNGWGAVVLGLALLFVSGLMLQKLTKGELRRRGARRARAASSQAPRRNTTLQTPRASE